MELRVLRYFLAVAREENITAAANSLHMTQPTLSRQLRDLEEELGQEGRRRDQLRLLATHRASLLDQLHVSQRQIDCLDYLVYQMSSRSDNHQGRNMETEA